MFETGFLGTRALWFMDVVTLWFGVLPFLMGAAIIVAKRGRFDLHQKAQTLLFVVTLVMVVLFEVGVRFSGGFAAYAEQSGVSFGALVTLLAVHILIAVVAVGAWAWLLIDALRSFRSGGTVAVNHKTFGQAVYAGMSVTSFLGVMIYWLLFVA